MLPMRSCRNLGHFAGGIVLVNRSLMTPTRLLKNLCSCEISVATTPSTYSIRPIGTSSQLYSLQRKKPSEILQRYRSERDKLRQKFKARIADVKDKIMTVPNGLCVLRICFTPVIGYLVVVESFLPACLLFAAAGFTDFLDGYIARRYPTQRSLFGSVLDPIADKFLISTLFVTLTYSHLIPVLLTIVVLSRDLLLVGGGFVRRYQMMESPVTLKRFFDPSISSVRVTPTATSKANTALQLSLVTLSLASPVLGFVDHPLLTVLGIVTAGTTICSGLQYVQGRGMIAAKKIRLRRNESSSSFTANLMATIRPLPAQMRSQSAIPMGSGLRPDSAMSFVNTTSSSTMSIKKASSLRRFYKRFSNAFLGHSSQSEAGTSDCDSKISIISAEQPMFYYVRSPTRQLAFGHMRIPPTQMNQVNRKSLEEEQSKKQLNEFYNNSTSSLIAKIFSIGVIFLTLVLLSKEALG
uniref:cardiolipin synthase (CMP-forming) n=1 Tax=Ditylenchus dipsaci TaxID=166011 RepID=A0A915ELQ7_9BILA